MGVEINILFAPKSENIRISRKIFGGGRKKMFFAFKEPKNMRKFRKIFGVKTLRCFAEGNY